MQDEKYSAKQPTPGERARQNDHGPWNDAGEVVVDARTHEQTGLLCGARMAFTVAHVTSTYSSELCFDQRRPYLLLAACEPLLENPLSSWTSFRRTFIHGFRYINV